MQILACSEQRDICAIWIAGDTGTAWTASHGFIAIREQVRVSDFASILQAFN